MTRQVAIAVDSLGSVYVTGYSVGAGNGTDYATIKYDNSGQQQWVAPYNGPGNGSQASGIAIDGSGNVYVTGESQGLDGIPDYATVKYNSLGQEQWVSRYQSPDNLGDMATAIAVSRSGNVYVTGRSWVSDGVSDYATIKYNSSGQEQWVARYDGPLHFEDYAVGIGLDRAENIYVTGASHQSQFQYDWDFATIKYIPDRIPYSHPRPSP